MLTIYNPTQQILIVKNKKGKIVKAFGGAIATEIWHKKLNKWATKSKN
ncbi:MAG TPA: hypothetical protein VF677_12660 [Flavobacterium sp.]|jgi:hypothetical protein